MIDIRQLDLEKDRRIIITSDIHTNLPLFKRLLEKVEYSTEDYLFIVGDLCEKGQDSLSTIAYVRELSAQSDRVFITKGNCDVVHDYVFNNVEGVKNYMTQRKDSILNEMLAAQGKSLEEFASLDELGQFYLLHYRDEIEWLNSLPIAYETNDYILIHAGIENIQNWKETTYEVALYTPSFYEKGHQADKTVIVGHWPTVNYRAKTVSSNNPVIDLENRIISMDGGNRIKRDGQLNAILIEGEEISYTYVDDLKEQIVYATHTDKTGRTGTVTYPNYELKIIREEPFFTLCENKTLGIEQWIKNEFIQDGVCKGDISTTMLSVREGETVSIVHDQCEGYVLVKKGDGTVGWIPKKCLSPEVQIRKAVAGDEQQIAEICINAQWATYSDMYDKSYIEGVIEKFYTPARIRQEIMETNKEWNGYFVAVQNGKIVGAIGGGMIDETVAEVYVLYLDPAKRGEGIGSKLLSYLTDFQKRSYSAEEQWVSVAKDNEKGIPFYEARGFVKMEERMSYESRPEDQAVSLRMKRKL